MTHKILLTAVASLLFAVQAEAKTKDYGYLCYYYYIRKLRCLLY